MSEQQKKEDGDGEKGSILRRKLISFYFDLQW